MAKIIKPFGEQEIVKKKRIGGMPARSEVKLLMMANFIKPTLAPPDEYNIWKKRSKFPLRSFGNTDYGCCTRASQALLSMRMERLETTQTPKIADDEVIRVYFEGTQKYYGGGDTGMYEIDALNEWRREDCTFKDTKGRALTIDAYTRINQANLVEVKNAIFLSKSHGIKIDFALPLAWSSTNVWDIPEGQQAIGNYYPGSWGYHSMTITGYDDKWFYLPSSWAIPDTKISHRALLTFATEAYLIIDSLDKWRKIKSVAKNIDLSAIKAEVNKVSSVQI